jgi:LytS/YehU family sensor histidine kinase
VIPVALLYITLVLGLAILVREFVATGRWDTSAIMDSNITVNDRKLFIGIWGFALLNSVLILPVLLIAYEIIYHYAQLRDAVQQREKLEKEKLKAELQQLKGIVNPHFLFNNLNSLSSLIAEDPVKAQEFLDELTKVFRYLLRNNDTELTTLAGELDFVNSYYRLLQLRYGAAISMDVRIDKTSEQLMIPPLTLQLLIENAVKHNRLQKEEPLKIELFTQPGNKLTVRNNLLEKSGKVESTGIGLQNINARYRMLGIPEAVIEKLNGSFSVIISLIESKVS